MLEKEVNRSQSPAEKPYQLTVEQRPQYLYIYVTGENDNYEISRRYWLEVAEHCRRTNSKKILIDEDIKEDASLADVYQLASELPQMGFFGVRIAFFDRYAAHQDLNEFGELVAINRGLYGKIFNNFDEAETWLLLD